MKDLDFDAMRRNMVREQLIPRGIFDKGVLGAFMKVPRHKFVDDEYLESAYADHPLPIGRDQTISQPYMVAAMTELLQIENSDKVLEIGTGSGYQLAVLCELAREAYSVERIEELAVRSDKTLRALGYSNFNIKVGDGTLGWEEHAPYDGIIVTAGAPQVPKSLLGQLNDGGRLVIPVGGSSGQMLTIVERSKGAFTTIEEGACVFVPLIGKEGWAGLGYG